MSGKLYIEVYIDNVEKQVFASIESFITLYVYQFCEKPASMELFFVETDKLSIPAEHSIQLIADTFQYKLIGFDQKNHEISDLKMPLYVKQNTSVAGLCSVCREIVMECSDDRGYRQLLGFKESCLLAPAECSIWTKFCEIDIIDAYKYVKNILYDSAKSPQEILLPTAFSRFETHMTQPVRIHNIYKLARDKANGVGKDLTDKENLSSSEVHDKKHKKKVFIESNVPVGELNLDHHFAEGCFVTLADVILYACYNLCISNLPSISSLMETIPLTFKWLNSLEKHNSAFKSTFNSVLTVDETGTCEETTRISFQKGPVENCSLYKSDPKRYRPKDRIYTRQDCVEESLEQFSRLNISATSTAENGFHKKDVAYDSILFHSYPDVGDLPEKRLVRKRQQLENLANAVISIAKDGDRIVDFCSGSGHLGIILAVMLPKCHIIFLENKSISLKRASDRAKKLELTNCSFYQTNLDYFIGDFDIGTSLHACGTATDIVIWQCIRSRASFVCCPCCYGSVTSMPHISYPLSEAFKTIMDQKNYLFIAHAADQAHNAEKTECNVEKSQQGQVCMDVIDTDRKLMAEEAGYKVLLTRLQPEDCTPKNRLLLGTIEKTFI